MKHGGCISKAHGRGGHTCELKKFDIAQRPPATGFYNSDSNQILTQAWLDVGASKAPLYKKVPGHPNGFFWPAELLKAITAPQN